MRFLRSVLNPCKQLNITMNTFFGVTLFQKMIFSRSLLGADGGSKCLSFLLQKIDGLDYAIFLNQSQKTI